MLLTSSGLALVLGLVAASLPPQSVLSSPPEKASALYHDLEEYARIVDLSYCVGVATGIQPPFSCLGRCSDFPDFRLVQTWNTGPLLSDSAGYIALDHKEQRVIVAFRGTYSISSVIADLSVIPQQFVPLPIDGSGPDDCAKCTVHMGFLQSWQNAKDAMLSDLIDAQSAHPGYTVNLVGHSLGGAVALLATLELQPRRWRQVTTTFGEPRVGNDAFVAHVDARIKSGNYTYRRVTHVGDPVAILPPKSMGYRSHAHEIFITRPSLPQVPEDLEICDGNEDAACSESTDWLELWQSLFSHRDYFIRMGICLPGGDMWQGLIPSRSMADDL